MAKSALPASVIAPVYKNTPYLKPAIQSILALDYAPLQIVIIDDASPDDAYDVVKRLVDTYSGSHEIILHRNETNLSMGNYNELMDRATADHIIVAHDDDIQYPNRVRRLMEVYEQQEVMMVTSNAMNIDHQGYELKPMLGNIESRRIQLPEVARAGRPDEAQGAALSWRREIFDIFGPISVDGTARTSDYLPPFRAALLGDIFYLNEQLLQRRTHANSRGKIGHASDDDDVTVVEMASERITQISYMLETLDAFVNSNPHRREELGLARENLVIRLEELARDLGTHRNRLHMRKMKMSWIGHGHVAEPEVSIGKRLERRLKTRLRSVGRKASERLKAPK